MQNRAQLIKRILEQGLRVFTLSEFAKVAASIGYSENSMTQLVYEMRQANLIELIKPGLYQLHDSYLSSPVSAYELGLAIVEEGYLSHLSAISIHQITDQLANIIYISTRQGKSRYKNKKSEFSFEAKGYRYKIIEVTKSRIFGIENKWIGDAQIRVADLERTLIDSLNTPQYCGGFYEVLNYFEQTRDSINLNKTINYASLMSKSCLQRLGWCFDKISFKEAADIVYQSFDTNTMVKLDSSGTRRGVYNNKWRVIENI
jgi:predicted transcriptional regulator of viral defense system